MGWRWTEAEVSREAQEAWKHALDVLHQLAPTVDEDGYPAPVVIPFTPEGKQIWVQFCEDHAEEVAAPGFPTTLRGPWAKMPAHGARLALILQLLFHATGEAERETVDERSVAAAWAFVDYFKSQARRVYQHLKIDPQDRQVEVAVRWITARDGACTARDLLTYGVAGTKKQSQAEALLKDLADRHLGTFEQRTPASGRGRKSTWFVLTSSQQPSTLQNGETAE